MARSVLALTLSSIPQPGEYTILGPENRADLQDKIPCNETVLQFLRPCQQKQTGAIGTKRNFTALQPKNMSSVGEGRIFWNGMADLITSSSFFPITLNVPDILSAMGSAMGSFISQLPIINRIYLYFTQESTPRKKKKKKKPSVPVQAQSSAQPVKTATSNGHNVKNRRVRNRRNRH